ncbi:hypothetical protein ACSVH5_05805 [Flavobacterium sp. RSSA_27]|uniref:hypothetical protein n=1 Tax=Flavobacterium sp. RSSA_27 TaxID=3447667 RepID=UPI003F3319DB
MFCNTLVVLKPIIELGVGNVNKNVAVLYFYIFKENIAIEADFFSYTFSFDSSCTILVQTKEIIHQQLHVVFLLSGWYFLKLKRI